MGIFFGNPAQRVDGGTGYPARLSANARRLPRIVHVSARKSRASVRPLHQISKPIPCAAQLVMSMPAQ
jgi:hypothetical protein